MQHLGKLDDLRMRILSVLLNEMIVLLHGCELEVDLFVRVLNLAVTVEQLVVLNFQCHKLLLDHVVVF